MIKGKMPRSRTELCRFSNAAFSSRRAVGNHALHLAQYAPLNEFTAINITSNVCTQSILQNLPHQDSYPSNEVNELFI